jgi:hypothetical protein
VFGNRHLVMGAVKGNSAPCPPCGARRREAAGLRGYLARERYLARPL